MYEGVEAGENEQGHHGAQCHHVVKLGLQHVAGVATFPRLIGRLIGHLIGGEVGRLVL